MSLLGLIPPCSYQGGKQRLSAQICDIIEGREDLNNSVFYDLCCGSGAIGLEMLSRGYRVVMIDKGPFGLVWEYISKGLFNLDIFKSEIDKLPRIEQIGTYLKDLSDKPVDKDLYVYHYLLLQSGSFGSKQIWTEGEKWCNNSFRNYWKPTETSNRKSPVNPMMPMPETLYSRVSKIVNSNLDKFTAYQMDIFDAVNIIKEEQSNVVIYIDPPYKNTTGYFESFDIFEVVNKLYDYSLYVSEGFEFENFENIVLSEGRKKGNVSGTVKKQAVKEVLNCRRTW